MKRRGSKLPMSLPSMLVHETLFKRPVLQISNKVPLRLTRSTRASSSCAATCGLWCAFGWWWVVRRGRLQSNRGIWIQVAHNSLQGWRNAGLLLIHGRRALPTRTSGGLCVEGLGLIVLPLLWRLLLRYHVHLLSISWLCRIWWRGTLVIWCVHVVHTGRLGMRRLSGAILIHLHIGVCLVLGNLLRLLLCNGRLLCLGPLFAHAFVTLLLLYTWCR